MLDSAGQQLQYTDKENMEQYYTLDQSPDDLTKKVRGRGGAGILFILDPFGVILPLLRLDRDTWN